MLTNIRIADFCIIGRGMVRKRIGTRPHLHSARLTLPLWRDA